MVLASDTASDPRSPRRDGPDAPNADACWRLTVDVYKIQNGPRCLDESV